jgi:hypothetical protein
VDARTHRTHSGKRVRRRCCRQQPAGDTPGVAAAPVALAGAIMPGVARFIVTLSAHAGVFGVGITAIVGSMLVPASCVTAGWIVPGGGVLGTSGVESGTAAPLVSGPPGAELHTVADALPSGDAGDMVPVVLLTNGVGMVPKAVVGIIVVDGVMVDGVNVAVLLAIDGAMGAALMEGGDGAGIAGVCAGAVEPGIVDMNDVAGCADSARIGAVVLSGAADIVGAAGIDGSVAVDMEVTVTVDVAGPICPVGVEQVTTVPGVVGSDASGIGASVVSAVPGWVVAENGLGPLSGDVTIVPGVDGRPMAVLPMVETCARAALQPASKMAVDVNSKRRIANPSSAV